jgi:hypothetical protein
MDSVEEYARRWTKSEGEELDTLSEWIKSIRKLLKFRIHQMSGEIRTIYPSVFKKTEAVNELRRLHDNFVLVSAYKASSHVESRTRRKGCLRCTGLHVRYRRKNQHTNRLRQVSTFSLLPCPPVTNEVKILNWFQSKLVLGPSNLVFLSCQMGSCVHINCTK